MAKKARQDYIVHEPQRNPDQRKRGEPPLSPREGKVLRFVVDRTAGKQPVTLEQTVNKIAWSDLPHTLLQAKATLGRLEALGLAQRDGDGYLATEHGSSLIAAANAAKWWNS